MKTDEECCQTAKDQDSRTLICFVGNVWYQLGSLILIALAQTPLQHSIPVRYEDVKMEKSSFIFHIWLTGPGLSLLSPHQSCLSLDIDTFPFSSPDSGWNASWLTGCWCLSFFHFSCCVKLSGAQWPMRRQDWLNVTNTARLPVMAGMIISPVHCDCPPVGSVNYTSSDVTPHPSPPLHPALHHRYLLTFPAKLSN